MPHAFVTTYANSWPPSQQTANDGVNIAFRTLKYGDLTVTPIMECGDYSFGAEVAGVAWDKPIADHIVKQLIELQDKYAVLVFRNTSLDNARHIAFSQQLGSKLETNPFYYGRENDRVGEPFLWDVSNMELDGSLVKEDSRRWHHSLGNALWHTDSSYHQQRPVVCAQAPENVALLTRGGVWTHFADTRRAYADLPAETKDRLNCLVVEHDLWHSRLLGSPSVYKAPTDRERALKPPAYHSLVQKAPNGQETLYLAAHAKRILGLDSPMEFSSNANRTPQAEDPGAIERSQTLIWQLIDHCTQPQYVFSLEWLDGGDLVWWDNRQSMHRANPYTSTMGARDVRRSTVIDDGPLAWGVSNELKESANVRAEGC
ncbi:putative alpha-ketoglutarate-dependent 2,4-dichlorophenoxyacetate dioxygenase [Hortaea werneckii]|nr:putative alpha-ketoglutarate-dependent 2,4-dichlorophenoxyacetate dioxygenase [Hortaea werneckii]